MSLTRGSCKNMLLKMGPDSHPMIKNVPYNSSIIFFKMTMLLLIVSDFRQEVFHLLLQQNKNWILEPLHYVLCQKQKVILKTFCDTGKSQKVIFYDFVTLWRISYFKNFFCVLALCIHKMVRIFWALNVFWEKMGAK